MPFPYRHPVRKARASLDKDKPSSKMSAPERRWAQEGNAQLILLDPFKGLDVVCSVYEWMSLRLPGGLYTPDFMSLLNDGQVIFVEVKETRMMQSYRDSRSKLRTAAALNPWFTFVMAVWKRKEKRWEIEFIPCDGKGWKSGIYLNPLDLLKETEVQ